MKQLVIATNNKHKLEEIQQMLGSRYNILSLSDIQCFEELPEEQDTLEGNALQKARYVFEKYRYNCFADDTGLEIEALNGKPGVYSARYSGKDSSIPSEIRSKLNMEKVLSEMHGKTNRNARFRTVIALIEDGSEKLFEGIVDGSIIPEKKGNMGFGYDPIFIPNGYSQTFAEMDIVEKNKISHRARAIQKLSEYLSNNLSGK